MIADPDARRDDAARERAVGADLGAGEHDRPLHPGVVADARVVAQHDERADLGALPDPDAALTDGPQVDPDITAPPPVDDLEDVPQDTTNRPQRLADTGIDTRLFLALGASLLLAGIGLRLRTIPERF